MAEQKRVKRALRGLIVWHLQHNGDVTHKSGVAQTVLLDAIKESAPYLPGFTKQTFSLIVNELEQEGYISRKVKGNRIYSIHLNHVGKIPDPFAEAAVRSSEQIIEDAQRLSMPERLFVASSIVDSCAEEANETYAQLSRVRDVVG